MVNQEKLTESTGTEHTLEQKRAIMKKDYLSLNRKGRREWLKLAGKTQSEMEVILGL